MLTKIIYKNFRSNLKNYILFFLSNIVAIMELFVFRGLKEIVLQIVKDTETAFLFRIDFTMALGMISVITIMLMAYAMIYYLKSRIRDYGLFIMMGMHKRKVFSLMLIEYVLGCILINTRTYSWNWYIVWHSVFITQNCTFIFCTNSNGKFEYICVFNKI